MEAYEKGTMSDKLAFSSAKGCWHDVRNPTRKYKLRADYDANMISRTNQAANDAADQAGSAKRLRLQMKEAMYAAMDAHTEKYGERPEDAAWKAFMKKPLKRFDHENAFKEETAMSQAD